MAWWVYAASVVGSFIAVAAVLRFVGARGLAVLWALLLGLWLVGLTDNLGALGTLPYALKLWNVFALPLLVVTSTIEPRIVSIRGSKSWLALLVIWILVAIAALYFTQHPLEFTQPILPPRAPNWLLVTIFAPAPAVLSGWVSARAWRNKALGAEAAEASRPRHVENGS